MNECEPTSARVRRVCAMFGIEPHAQDQARLGRAALGAAMLDEAIGSGGLALVIGPSGSGKSSILTALRARLRETGRPVVVLPRAMRHDKLTLRVIDAIDRPMDDALRVLARAGLADAHLIIRPIGQLSDGQWFRLRIAMTMDKAQRRGAWVLIDELASGLDRATGFGLCATLGRWARGCGLPVVCASACDDLLEALAPDVVLDQPLACDPVLVRHGIAS